MFANCKWLKISSVEHAWINPLISSDNTGVPFLFKVSDTNSKGGPVFPRRKEGGLPEDIEVNCKLKLILFTTGTTLPILPTIVCHVIIIFKLQSETTNGAWKRLIGRLHFLQAPPSHLPWPSIPMEGQIPTTKIFWLIASEGSKILSASLKRYSETHCNRDCLPKNLWDQQLTRQSICDDLCSQVFASLVHSFQPKCKLTCTSGHFVPSLFVPKYSQFVPQNSQFITRDR